MAKNAQKLNAGKDSVVIGNVEGTVGNGATIVGATDNKGNTILNQGGMAVGRGAHAGPSSIAIGTGANAGAQMHGTNILIELNNSIVGLLNTGEIEKVHTISTNISSVASTGNVDIARAFKAITEAITQSDQLIASQRSETLDAIEELTRQANASVDSRAKPGVLRSLFQNLATTLSAAGDLAEVWSLWGDSIKTYFDL